MESTEQHPYKNNGLFMVTDENTVVLLDYNPLAINNMA